MQPSHPAPAPDPIHRFDARAADYVRSRPGYPAAAFAAVLDGLGAPSLVRAVDLGAGTGISSRALAELGASVVAVEPNAEMRNAAAAHPRVTWLDARAESLPLPDASFELALAAQAFHWFEPAPALREIARVLVAGGRLALLWNVRDLTDAATAEYSDVVARGAQRAREEAFHLWPEELAGSGSFDACWERSFAHAQALDADGLIGRARSASYVPLAADDLAAALRAFHARRADATGCVTIRYRTRLYLAERRRGGGGG